MNGQLISKALLSSVRDQLLSSARQEQNELKDNVPELCEDPPTTTDDQMDIDSPQSVGLDLDKKSDQMFSMRLDSYPNTDPLLDELLGDIRRSVGTSIASTPTLMSSDGDRGDSVFECKLRRSKAELRSLGKYLLFD